MPNNKANTSLTVCEKYYFIEKCNSAPAPFHEHEADASELRPRVARDAGGPADARRVRHDRAAQARDRGADEHDDRGGDQGHRDAQGRRGRPGADARVDRGRQAAPGGREARAAAGRGRADRRRPVLRGAGPAGRLGDRRRRGRPRPGKEGPPFAADRPARPAPGQGGRRQRRGGADRRRREAAAVPLPHARRVRRHGPQPGGGDDARDPLARLPGVVPRPHLPPGADARQRTTRPADGGLDRRAGVRARLGRTGAARPPAGAPGRRSGAGLEPRREEGVGGAGVRLDHGPRLHARLQPVRRDGAVDAHRRAVLAQPDQVEREAHRERVDGAAAGDQQRVVAGHRVEPGEATHALVAAPRGGDAQAARQRARLESVEPRAVAHPMQNSQPLLPPPPPPPLGDGVGAGVTGAAVGAGVGAGAAVAGAGSAVAARRRARSRARACAAARRSRAIRRRAAARAARSARSAWATTASWTRCAAARREASVAALAGSGVGAGVDVGATLATGSGTTSGSAAEPPRLPLSRLTAITSSAMPAHEYSPSSTTGLPNGPRRLRGGRPTA